MGTIDSLLSGLSGDVGVRGREFELVCKWFLENAPLYRAELARVWLWRDWPGRWGADAGIDLVALDRRGRLWAVQAKAYSPDTTVTKADVDTFLSESSRAQFSFRLLIATTDRIGSTARRTLQGQEKPASVLVLSDLRATTLEWPASVDSLLPARSIAKLPRPHQVAAVADVVAGLACGDRGRLVMACGSGKTLVSLFVAERLSARRVLVLVPSLSLLAQTLDEWTANASLPMEFLPVCSDDTVADSDAPVASTSDLGFPVTTDPADIAAFLRGASENMRVVFSTYQSSPRVAEAMRLADGVSFDLVIADEAHRCAGRVSSDFATVLDGEAIRAGRRLFMTATPRYFTGRVVREAKEADFEVASMDDEATFGPLLHRLTFAQAIEQELLTDYQVAIIGVDDEMYRQWADNGRFVTTDGTEVTDARTLAAQIGVAKAVKSFDLRRTITFHSRVAAARRFSEELPGVIRWMPAEERPSGDIACDYISGAMSAGERRRRLGQLRDLEGDRALVSNARCLTEGIDVPALDAVAFIDPRRSEVDIVQAVGRAIRRAPDKKIGTIVLPVFISDTDDAAVALDDSAFKPVWDVLNALRAHDEELAESLDALRRQLGQRPGVGVDLPPKIRIDLPARVSIDFASAMRVQLVEQTTGSWEYRYGLLLAFIERNGYARPPFGHVEAGVRLGSWVITQRVSLNAMRPERRVRLEALPGWTWDPLADKWEKGFELLAGYAEREGHARPPINHVEAGFRLGTWVTTQRTGRDAMGPDRQERLEALPGWAWDAQADKWEKAFELLAGYSTREGHAQPPKDHIEAEFRLGGWVATQRMKREAMGAERRVRLEALPGWTWNTMIDKWEKSFELLAGYASREGHARTPVGHVEAGTRLGSWVNMQRTGRNGIGPERQVRLEALPGWTWNTMIDKWEKSFELLAGYASREGHARPPRGHIEAGVPLGKWVNKQRMSHDSMGSERQVRLEALPGWTWDARADRWEKAFELLAGYAEREGYARPPTDHVEAGVQLGSWVRRQRTSRDEMGADRKNRLEALPGWTWDPFADRWEYVFELLAGYAAREGHARPPQDHIEAEVTLGKWVNTQRVSRDAMKPERQVRLEALPGWTWNTREHTATTPQGKQ